ncbi:hypothetical protein AAC387_Pa07g1995 [Persea americana]
MPEESMVIRSESGNYIRKLEEDLMKLEKMVKLGEVAWTFESFEGTHNGNTMGPFGLEKETLNIDEKPWYNASKNDIGH